MAEINRRVVLGTFAESQKIGRYSSPLHLRVDIQYGKDKLNPSREKPHLFIWGETYYPGKRDFESGGQILDDVRRLLDDANAHLNYPREQIVRLLEVWQRWNSNDMRAGCEHQRAAWNPLQPVVLVTYEVRDDVREARRKLEKRALADLVTQGSVTLTTEEQELFALKCYTEIVRDADEPPPDPNIYVERKSPNIYRPSRETTTAGWVTTEKSPKGILSKPCPTCGYKYGTAWLYEEVPADVVAFLESFGG